MRPAEARAIGRLAGEAAARGVAHTQQIHGAVAQRVFAVVPGSQGAEAAHNLIARGIYTSVASVMKTAGQAAGSLAALVPMPTAPPIGSTRRANSAVSALNAAFGDRLAEDQDPLAISMAVRLDGRDVPANRVSLRSAFPGVDGRIVLFVHGLGETEDAWQRHAERHYGDPIASYGSLLRSDLGLSPVYLRYNTGLHISENGSHLSRLLTDLVENWPSPVEEIVVVGHSMGGLVIRSACHYGDKGRAPWVPFVRHIFYLGSPHLGAPLERLAGYAGWGLAKMGETRPWADLVNARSAGIKDLRHGYIVDDDWAGCDPDNCLRDHRHDVALLASANHYAISATITADPAHRLGRVIGDLLVQPASAQGRHRRGRHISFDLAGGYELASSHHLDLLNHPDVYSVMSARLLPAAGRGAETSDRPPPTPELGTVLVEKRSQGVVAEGR